MKRKLTALLAALCITAVLPVHAGAVDLPLTSRAAVLMEKTTGQMLFAQNEHEKLEPASVTKIMTLLLTMDAIDSGALAYDDVVTVSANAAGMGGSQVFLAEGEQITVEELLKCVCVSSGNDAAVALAEKVAGVTELFVEQMNNRARGLGMDDTHFANPTGLTAAGHVTSAYDIALMSRELLTKHPDIRNFTTIWTDSIRNGTFDLANTNKLIRWYDGATGLKTGYTASAGYCISATAEREGMELIAVVMKGETSDKRNTDAKALLNYGFSAYTLVSAAPEEHGVSQAAAAVDAEKNAGQFGNQGGSQKRTEEQPQPDHREDHAGTKTQCRIQCFIPVGKSCRQISGAAEQQHRAQSQADRPCGGGRPEQKRQTQQTPKSIGEQGTEMNFFHKCTHETTSCVSMRLVCANCRA